MPYKGRVPRVHPFIGLLYDERVAGPLERLTTPPYDSITAADRRRYHAASPYNVAHLILGEDRPGDDEERNRHTRAGEALRRWRSESALIPTPEPAVYPYEMRFHFGGRPRRIRGVIAEVDLEPWGADVIPHERTLTGPLHDRLRLLRAARANLSAIYAMLRGPSDPLASFLAEVARTPPAREVADETGTSHRLWASPAGSDLVASALADEPLMIADGHHRYTVALTYRDEMRAAHGPGPWDRIMMLIVDDSVEQPPVLPYHRLVHAPPAGGPGPGSTDPAHRTLGEAPPWVSENVRSEVRVPDLAEVLATVRDEDATAGLVRLEDGQLVHSVLELDGGPPTVRSLHEGPLAPVGPERLRFDGDAVAAEEAVQNGEAEAAFILPPTSVGTIRAIAERGGRLPEKSTLFWPKPRTGMIMRALDGAP